ncbi:hypothetical protein JMJ77_0007512, partial [Colletotrichum scovillei]
MAPEHSASLKEGGEIALTSCHASLGTAGGGIQPESFSEEERHGKQLLVTAR